ncbi:hypothetical protein DFH09DRAFT_1084138 [Mycena vulgaris]|nr:hypothetical protein DFH09DRAFT_1084138 [Mycena vulgaris]
MLNDLSTGLAQLTERVGNTQYKPSKSRRAAPIPFPAPFASLPQNFGLLAPSPFVAQPSPPSASSAPFPNFTINISSGGTVISGIQQTTPFLPTPLLQSSSLTVNNSFNAPPPPLPPAPQLSMPFTPAPDPDLVLDSNVPNAKWEMLCRKFSTSQLAAHKWSWTAGDWLPTYEHPPISQIMAVWNEWVRGVEGCIPIEMLTRTWGGSWKHNIGKVKTESSRHMKIVTLVQELAARPRWSDDFLGDFLLDGGAVD